VTDDDRRLRVLCLEDSPLDAELVRETLAGAGYQLDVSLAPDRHSFEELLGGGPYDVILADFALPGFDAHAALPLARAALPETPFICVSGRSGRRPRSSCSSRAPTISCSRTGWRACRSPYSAPSKTEATR
jgi:CheY-like chemotaxis protein